MTSTRSGIKILSSTQIDAYSSQTVYKVGYANLVVTNIFSDTEDLEDLFYQLLQNKISACSDECYTDRAIGSHVISVEQGGNVA
jgi:preprotein translocase subunit SecA